MEKNQVLKSVNMASIFIDDGISVGIGKSDDPDQTKSTELSVDEEGHDEPMIETVGNPIDVDADGEEVLPTNPISTKNDSLSEEYSKSSQEVNKSELVLVSTSPIMVERISSETTIVKFPLGIQIKDEQSAQPQINTTDGILEENDPMNLLLELNDRSDSISRSNGEDEDDISSTGSSSAQTNSSSSNILEWCKEYSWLLYEESDEMYGYCLYCDAKLNVRAHHYVKQHGLSLYHKERSDNYLSFREEEERNNLGTPLVEIKQEFGTDSYVAALKLKRKTQAEALNNYNWRRWLGECLWLERDSPAGTVGRCKYCGIRLNVEFSYLRTRHQETGKHKECAKQYEKAHSNNKAQTGDEANDRQQTPKSSERYRWGDLLEDNMTMHCRLCDTKMTKNNLPRHLRTNLHLQNESKYINSLKQSKAKKNKASSIHEESETTVSGKIAHTWDMYAKQHPWLTADPSDPVHAYCKYCEKRVLYGNSAAKRATHENSIQHKNQENVFKERVGKEIEQDEAGLEESADDSVDEETGERDGEDEIEGERNGSDIEDVEEEDMHNQADDGDEEAEEEEEEQDVHDEETADIHDDNTDKYEQDSAGDSKKRIYRNDSEWYDRYPWCKKYKADYENYCYCSYCKIAIAKSSRNKHRNTARHQAAEAEYLKRTSKKKSLFRSKAVEDLFEWAVDIKAQPNLYYCKYCRVRISKHYSKKQHSVSKIHQINENLYASNRINLIKSEVNIETKTPSIQQRNESSSLKKVMVKSPSVITLVKQWQKQKRFPWLTYKRSELRSNYAFCKVCELSVYIRSVKNVIKHQRSGRHLRCVNKLRRQKLQEEREQEEASNIQLGPKREFDQNTLLPPEAMQKESTHESNRIAKHSHKESTYKSTIGEMQKRFSWIEKSRKPQYAYCRYCDQDIVLKILFLRNHSNSHQHRQAVVNYRVSKTKTEKQQLSGSNADDDDVMLVEENTEEILISEQDDNWTVKSENMDEHEALDYLLQQSGKTNDNNGSRYGQKSTAGEECPSKRAKRSHSFRKHNESNSSLVASILSTPLTLASCLGPLIQQQIQQVANSQAHASGTTAPAHPTTVAAEPENSYDLFFKSVSETMKKLPVDLAAEGKLKVMQILCDLELKALTRQQLQSSNDIQSMGSSNLIVNSSVKANSSISNKPAEREETSCTVGSDNETVGTAVQCNKIMNETVTTPFYSNANTSPSNNHQQGVPVSTTTLSVAPSECSRNKLENSNQSPIIGVMDKNGLHTLQFKNAAVVKQVSQGSIKSMNGSAISNSSIRCIPFKSLTQTVNTEGTRDKVTVIQVPNPTVTTSTSRNAQSNMATTNAINTSKTTMLNVCGYHIAKNNPTELQTATSTAVSPVLTITNADKNTQGTHITTTNVQRWTSVNVSLPTTTPNKQTPTQNFHLSAKQTSTPIARSYK